MTSATGVAMKQHYDVGVIGWWYNANTGAVLTYYALYKFLQSLGYSVLMINEASGYHHRPQRSEELFSIQFAKRQNYAITEQCDYTEMAKYNKICDTFITGSDQLWNPLIGQVNNDCFLDFVSDNNKKISYATSFGLKDYAIVKSDFIQTNAKNLQRFSAVSVREDYCVAIARDFFGVNAVQVCDPVFLADKEDFDSLSENANFKTSGPYLLAFILDPGELLFTASVQKLEMRAIITVEEWDGDKLPETILQRL